MLMDQNTKVNGTKINNTVMELKNGLMVQDIVETTSWEKGKERVNILRVMGLNIMESFRMINLKVMVNVYGMMEGDIKDNG